MSAKVIDGKAAAQEIRDAIQLQVDEMVKKGFEPPGLATVLVGEDMASSTYVRMKHQACHESGLRSYHNQLSSDCQPQDLLGLIKELNQDSRVHGILVQLPLPKHIPQDEILQTVAVEKDVDGFHPVTIGRLAQKGLSADLLLPCTPSGIVHLLKKELGSLQGKNVVVLGRSNIVGMPTALMLTKEDATVTICHSRSIDLPGICSTADILIAAVGKAELVKKSWVKPGAVVIDVGVNRVDDPSSKRGYRMVGDVAFEEVSEVASAITKVTGGVGPMTIGMLLRNTLRASQMQQGVL